jgi:hypothetical protein
MMQMIVFVKMEKNMVSKFHSQLLFFVILITERYRSTPVNSAVLKANASCMKPSDS